LIGIQGKNWIFIEYLAYSPSQERTKKCAITAVPFNHNIDLLKELPDRPFVKQGKAEDDSEGNIMIGTGFETTILLRSGP